MDLNYPIGQQSFKKIRENNQVYIDKTGLIYELTRSYNYKFLARPRRFGKSLLLSTIASYFEGKKELFKGLAIYNLEKEWKKFPVLHLMMSRTVADDKDSLCSILEEQFLLWEKRYGLESSPLSYSSRFSLIIRGAYEQEGLPVVVLIDEYDHPLTNTLNYPEIHEYNRNLLRSVYSVLKDMDEYIRFGMLTGVSRFSKAGIFSGLNNLDDITLSEKYSTICGFTEEEVKQNLRDGVRHFASKEGIDESEALEILKKEYDGYHFSKDLVDIYNPYSFFKALNYGEIQNYWVDSGTPDFLVTKLKETTEPFFNIFNEEADTTDLESIDTAFSSPVALLYQTGYLTIKGYDKLNKIFKLGVPNNEVRDGFFSVLLSYLAGKDRRNGIRETNKMRECLLEGNPDGFLERLQSFFAGISYNLISKAPEIYFENNLFVVLQLMGFDTRAEDETSYGRIDLSVKTPDYIYIIEIKLDKSPEEALQQIERKEYGLKYKYESKQIINIGINFSSEKRNIDSWIIQKL